MLGLNGAFSSSSILWTSCLDNPDHSFSRPNSPAVTMFFASLCTTQTPPQHKRKTRIFNPVNWNFSICLAVRLFLPKADMAFFRVCCQLYANKAVDSVKSCLHTWCFSYWLCVGKRSSDSKGSAFMADVGSWKYIFRRLSLHSLGSLIVSGLKHLATLNQVSFQTTP